MQSTSVVAEEERSDVAVLVVDDQEIFRQVLREVIACTRGFALVGEAASGEEATRAVTVLSPGLVVMDVLLRESDSISAARSILGAADAPLVVMASANDQALRAAASELGEQVACVRKQDLVPARLKELWEAHRK